VLKNYLNGRWVASHSPEKHATAVIDPATGETLDQCPKGDAQDLEDAVYAAENAFSAWRATPLVERIQPLFRLKSLMEENQDEVSKIITKENGKTLSESKGSLRRAIQMVETATSMPVLMKGETSENIARGIDCHTTRQPLGVFAGITPFNFPAMVAYWFWPYAVAAGNSFVLKPSERVPLTQQKLFELIDQAGFPPGVINLLLGDGNIAEALCRHPKVQGISFVGSTPIAKKVYESCAKTGKRVQALGGAKNFMVILPDADFIKSTETALESILGCAGERCLAGSLILCVGEKSYEAVRELATERVQSIAVGGGLLQESQMGPVISEFARKRIVSLIDRAEKEGGRILVDGRKHPSTAGKGFFLGPTVIADVKREMEIAKVEIFGPVVCIAHTDDFDKAIEWMNSSSYGNTATLFTQSGGAAREFVARADPGMLGINIGVPAPMSYFSFGGSKDSFFGDLKAHGAKSVEFFTDEKTTITRWFVSGSGGASSIWAEK